jgi:hypothetical protein
LFESGFIGIILIIAVAGFLVFSASAKKRKEKKQIRLFEDRVHEYIHQQKILNPFTIYRDIESSPDIPREVLRKMNAFEYIDRAVKQAKAEKGDESGIL